MKSLKEILVEKTLTPEELSKREEVALAIEREHPDMPKSQKMAIATSVAIRSEGFVRVPFEGDLVAFHETVKQRGGNIIKESESGKQYFVTESAEIVGTLDKNQKAFLYE